MSAGRAARHNGTHETGDAASLPIWRRFAVWFFESSFERVLIN